MFKKVCISLFVVFVFSFALFAQEKATLSKQDDAFYWKIDGVDAEGNPSVVYILGTFHIGDDRLYPLPANIVQDFNNADIICGEISTEGWADYQKTLMAKMMESYNMADGRSVDDFLTPEELDVIYEKLDPEKVKLFFSYSPMVLYTQISSFSYSDLGIDLVQAYDQYFITRANRKKRHMDGLDTIQTQIDCLFYGDYDFQLAMLKTQIKTIQDTSETTRMFLEMYEAYLSHDVKTMETAYFTELAYEIQENPGMQEYYESLLNKRNKDWAVKIANYIKNGGTTFIFAGVGHFIGEDSVFVEMSKNGTLDFTYSKD